MVFARAFSRGFSRKGASIISEFFHESSRSISCEPAQKPWQIGHSRSMSVEGPVAFSGKLSGKVAIITGAGSGIGRETALLFAHEGASVIIADKTISQAARTIDAVREFGGTGIAIGGDVSIAADVEKFVTEAEKNFGAVHIVFNNAGIMDDNDGDAITTSDEVIDRTLDINVKGVIYGCRYGIPAIRRAGGGSVINTASFVAFLGAATPQIAYTASKGAVLALTRELAVLHARENIRVNALCPGPIRTKLLMEFLNTEEKKQRRLVHIPMGRFGEASEIAKAALFLASSDSSFVTGTSLLVDGGITSAYVTPE
ncbi:hypothetical protein O6H91_23G060400 [Diphasiastrum complanatum]|uniref:Uncharacterized protein n=1 Tax=Diphasiastrum complanatum TaxID=34168 RepID=A0ACC2AB65_DIPCM|nr:hypothetical protein O6H91_23G060400 [Diphasiastrum complanatum]